MKDKVDGKRQKKPDSIPRLSGNFEIENEEIKRVPVDPYTQLTFAKWILAVLAFIFIFSSVLYVFDCTGNAGKEIFDFVKTSVPPLVTFILGHYFAKNK